MKGLGCPAPGLEVVDVLQAVPYPLFARDAAARPAAKASGRDSAVPAHDGGGEHADDDGDVAGPGVASWAVVEAAFGTGWSVELGLRAPVVAQAGMGWVGLWLIGELERRTRCRWRAVREGQDADSGPCSHESTRLVRTCDEEYKHVHTLSAPKMSPSVLASLATTRPL